MKILKLLLLFILVIILSSCSQPGIKINDDILDKKQAKEMKINTDLIHFDDFELEKNSDWLIPDSLDDEDITGDGSYNVEQEKNMELEKTFIDKMKDKKSYIDGMNLVLNKNNFSVFWNKNKGKVYLYDDEKESLQFLLDTDIFERSLEEAIQEGKAFFRINANKEHLHLANEDYLYQFDHQGRQTQTRRIPEGFKILTLEENLAVLAKEGKLYIYLYSKDSITHVFEDEYFLHYYRDYLILQKASEIYLIDFQNNKKYYHQEIDMEDMHLRIFPISHKMRILDKGVIDGIGEAPRVYKINLPKS